jgi:hypothetical protein
VFWRRKGGDIMTNKKDLMIAVLATFCLTSALFMIAPTRSQSTTGIEYDPWADINDDGKIDMRDIRFVAKLFGTYGDPINKTALLYEVNATFTELLSRIDSLNSSLLNLEAYLNTRIVTLNSSLVELQSKVAELENNVTILETDMDTLRTNFDFLNATVVSLMERINALEGFAVNSTYGTSILATTETQNWVDMTGVSVNVTLTKTSKLLIMFSTEAQVQGYLSWTDASIWIRALVEGNVTYPGWIYLTPTVSQELGAPTKHRHNLGWSAYSYSFYLPSVAEGTYTIKLQWRVSVTEDTGYSATGYIRYRTLIVLAFPE